MPVVDGIPIDPETGEIKPGSYVTDFSLEIDGKPVLSAKFPDGLVSEVRVIPELVETEPIKTKANYNPERRLGFGQVVKAASESFLRRVKER